jgi:small ligand-binding sensory domain FIST
VNQKPGEAGAILFSCLGRGKRLYGRADHDSTLLKSVMGNIPVGGFFCNGEIGPVAGKTYLHGYTSSIAVFSAPEVKTVAAVSRSSSQTLP